MHDGEVILCHSELCFGKLVGILKALVLLTGLKALGLDSCHIENIEGRNCALKIFGLNILTAAGEEMIILHVIGDTKLLGRDEHEGNVLISGHCRNQGMYGSAIFQVATDTYNKVVEAALFLMYSKKVGQGLGGVEVSAVTCINDRHA